MDEVKKLVILGKVDRLIRGLSRKTRVNHLAYSEEDIVQELTLKTLMVIDEYRDRPICEIIAACTTSILNLRNCLLRRDFTGKRDADVVDLEEAMGIGDYGSDQESYINIQVEQLYELFDHDEQLIFSYLLYPEDRFNDLVKRHAPDIVMDGSGRLSRRNLAKSTGISKRRIEDIINSIREKATPALGLETA